MKPIHYYIPFVNLLIAALLGVLLRAAFVFPLEGITFLYVLHGHSHVALLGWLYLLVYVLFVEQFALQTPEEDLFYRRLFWVTQIAVVGMTVTFPFQGYAVPSIFFSTLHIICSYVFAYRLGRYHRIIPKKQALWMKTALFFMVFSTLGVWFLGPAIGMMGKASAFFQLCIQFFLHFQFDGWFFTAFIALLFPYAFSTSQVNNSLNRLYVLWIAGVVLTYALPVSWYHANPFLYYFNGGGVILQTLALYAVIKPLWKRYRREQTTTPFSMNGVFILGISCMGIRLVLQLLTLIEPLALALKGMRAWIVGFIHLNMLGIFTALGLWLLFQKEKFKFNRSTKVGCFLLFLGFILTESLLGLQGLQHFVQLSFVDNDIQVQLLFWFSILLPASVVCFLVSGTRSKA